MSAHPLLHPREQPLLRRNVVNAPSIYHSLVCHYASERFAVWQKVRRINPKERHVFILLVVQKLCSLFKMPHTHHHWKIFRYKYVNSSCTMHSLTPGMFSLFLQFLWFVRIINSKMNGSPFHNNISLVGCVEIAQCAVTVVTASPYVKMTVWNIICVRNSLLLQCTSLSI